MNTKNRNVLLTYLFILLSFFVLVLFTKGLYSQMVEQKETLSSLKSTHEQTKQKYETLAQLKQDIDAGKYAEYNLEKYVVNFSEDELSNYFYTYANAQNSGAKIESISFTPGVKNEFGFLEGNMNLSVVFNSELDMLNMMTEILTSAQYQLYIHQFEYPLGEISGPFQVEIPLKILYK